MLSDDPKFCMCLKFGYKLEKKNDFILLANNINATLIKSLLKYKTNRLIKQI